MNIVGIIPARMGSTRFPGKPLVDILGKAMIYHVYHRSKLCKKMNSVYIATCDKEIKEYCENNDMKVVMTKDTHERCSDRTAEAMVKIERKIGGKIDIVVMIQGDEPMVVPQMIKRALSPMVKNEDIGVVNLMATLRTRKEELDPNQVKLVVDKKNFAMYYSREPIPSSKKWAGNIAIKKQVPIIPFRRDFLLKFNKLSPTPLEEIESVDMLRVLEHGYKVKMVDSPWDNYSVDTPEDLKKVIRTMKKDKFLSKYL
ncbi:MAG: 3-deoxy-manno-octulosonate cytidylyltransferase [Candidatus Omnitrophota bacterium]